MRGFASTVVHRCKKVFLTSVQFWGFGRIQKFSVGREPRLRLKELRLQLEELDLRLEELRLWLEEVWLQLEEIRWRLEENRLRLEEPAWLFEGHICSSIWDNKYRKHFCCFYASNIQKNWLTKKFRLEGRSPRCVRDAGIQVFCSDAVVQFFQIVPHSNDDFMPPYIIYMHLNINYLKYF